MTEALARLGAAARALAGEAADPAALHVYAAISGRRPVPTSDTPEWHGYARRIAERAGAELEEATPQEIVRWAATTFGDRLCVTASMADAIVSHLVSAIKPGIDVLFLDTGYHFAETIGTRDAVAAVYDVNVVNVTPTMSVARQGHRLRQGPVGPRPRAAAARCARSRR